YARDMSFPVNRRAFVKTAATVAVAAGLGLGGGVVANADDDHRKYYRGPIKIACNAYCFNKIMLEQFKGGPDDMDLMKLLDWCADPAHRFDTLDATGYYFPPGNFMGQPFTMPSTKYLKSFKRKADDLGIPITGTGIHNDFASPDPAARAADVTKLMTIIRKSPFRKPLPIEVLEEFNVPYNPFVVTPQFLHTVREAIDETAELRFA
ncbi:MAG TPA: twin-arginine translocation signal domain-containing protein, partial [Pseudonocardiaceae bacterium]